MARKTRDIIRQSFLALLDERPFDKISVRDIAEKSGITRNTFYYYYADIYALVADIFEAELEHLVHDISTSDSWQTSFRTATAFLVRKRRAVYHIYHSSSRDLLERYYRKAILTAMVDFVRKIAEGLTVAESKILALARFYTAALTGLTADWLSGGMKDQPDAFLEDLGTMLDGNIRLSLERCSS